MIHTPRMLGGLALLAALAACHHAPKTPGRTVDVLHAGALEQLNPADVAVAPIANESGNARVPAKELRREFYQGLVKRRYSPLALAYVDQQAVDASYKPGSSGEQAVLQIVVRKWDDHMYSSHGRILAEVDARMLDAKDPDGAELWTGRVSRTFDLSQQTAASPGSTAGQRELCKRIASEILAAMPARRAAPGWE